MGGSAWTWMVLCCALLGACGPPRACEEVHGEEGCPQDFDVKVEREGFDLRLEIQDRAGMASFTPTGKGKALLLRKGTEEVLHRIETEEVAGRSVRVVLSQEVLRAVGGAEVELMLFVNGRRSGRSRISLPLMPVFYRMPLLSKSQDTLQGPQVYEKKIWGSLYDMTALLYGFYSCGVDVTNQMLVDAAAFGPLLRTSAMGLVSESFVGVNGAMTNYFLVRWDAEKKTLAQFMPPQKLNVNAMPIPIMISNPGYPFILVSGVGKLHAFAWDSNNVTSLNVPPTPADARLAAIYPSLLGPAAFLLDTQDEIHVLQSQNLALTVDENWTRRLRAGLPEPRSGWLAFTLGDVNGDGAVDLAYADGQGIHFVLLDEKGTRVVPVAPPLVPMGEGQITGLALGDLLGSPLPELVVARREKPLLVYRNNTP
jgi:hypothetical protein